MSDDPRRHHSPREELDHAIEAIHELERRAIRLGKMRIPLPRKRWIAAGAGVFVMFMVAALFVVTRTGVAKALILPQLSGVLAVNADAERVVIEPDGRLVVEELSMAAPGVRGPAAEFLHVGRLEATIDWPALFGGSVVVKRLKLTDPVATLSQNRATGRLNVAGLALVSGKQSAGAPVLPEIESDGAEIVIGEHDDESMEDLRRLVLDADSGLTKVGEAYELLLTETGQPADRAPMRVRGRLDESGFELALDAITLEQWAGDEAPSRVRELLDTIAMEGELSGANLRYGADGDVTLRIDLDGVALTLPVGAPADAQPGEVGPRMTGVTGSITFERTGVEAALVGAIEGVPFDVQLIYGGFGPNAPLDATLKTEDWWLEGQPAVLRYAPRMVRWRLETFGYPSALVDATVTLSRGAAISGRAAPLDFEGVIAFENGTAAYHWFPYEFQDMEGTIRLTNQAMTIERITGTAPSGARVTAEGTIAPPKPGAEVDLRISADGVPVDDTLIGALGEHRRKLVYALFNNERYEELLDAGLVLSPTGAAALRADIGEAVRLRDETEGEASVRWAERVASAEAELATPVFEPGGIARVDVRILRALGDYSEFERRIEVTLPEAGLLPEHFPLPIVARDLKMVILNNDLWLEGGAFSSLRGGEADVTVEASLGNDADGKPKKFAPTITIDASDVPVDDLLIHAIPGPRDRRTAERGTSVGQILTDLQLEGTADCIAYIAPRSAEDLDLGFDVHARFDGLTARPAPLHGEQAVVLEGVTGDVHVTQRELDLNLTADARPGATDLGEALPDPVMGVRSLGKVELAAAVTFPRDSTADPVFSADVQGSGVDLRGPFEDVVAIFSPQAAQILADLRAQRRPEGVVTLTAEIRSRDEGRVDVGVVMRDLRAAAFDAAGGRLQMGETAGALRVDTGDGARVSFESFAAPIAFNGEPAGVIAISGRTPVGIADDHDARVDEMALDVELRSGRFDSGLIRSISTTRLGDGFAALYGAVEPGGVFDLGLTAQPVYDDAEPGEPIPLRLGGVIHPKSFDLTMEDTRVSFAPVDGLVEFGRDGGAFTRIQAVSDGWTLRADGDWSSLQNEPFRIASDFAIEASGLPGGLRAVLPPPLVASLDGIGLEIDGLLRVADASVAASRVEMPDGAGEWLFETAGRVAFTGASMEAGVPVDEAEGQARFTASRPSLEDSVAFEVRLAGDRAKVAGVRTTGLTAQARHGPAEGSVIVPMLAADCHGGRVSGDARIFPLESGEGVRYEANVRASGVGLASVIADLTPKQAETDSGDLANGAVGPGGPGGPGVASPAVPPEGLAGADRSRGVLDGRLGLVGRTGPNPERQGSGLVQASGGRVLELPLVLRLIEVSNLTAPSGEDLDFGRASLLVDGDRLTFEDISVFSQTVEILGYGELDWPTKALDLRFNSRASRRIPVISDVLESVRDELISTEVVGTVAEPIVRVATFAGTRGALGRILGDRTDRDRRMEEIARRARIERDEQSKVGVRRPIVGQPVDGSP
ncbi:MAG: hypothetical protein AAF138_08410 [Planctomycetota bacterium]